MFKFKKIKIQKKIDPYFLVDFYIPQFQETKTIRIFSDKEKDLNNYLSNFEIEKDKISSRLKDFYTKSNYITKNIKIKNKNLMLYFPVKINKIKKENIIILNDEELNKKIEKKINDLAIKNASKISMFFISEDSKKLMKNYIEGERNNLNRLVDILLKDFKYKNYIEVEKQIEQEKNIRKFLKDILIIQRKDFEKEEKKILKDKENYRKEKETVTEESLELLNIELRDVKYFDEDAIEYSLEVIKISEMIEKF